MRLKTTKLNVILGIVVSVLLVITIILYKMDQTSPQEKPSITKVAGEITPTPSKAKSLYRCPMHPHIVSDHPGTCPICHMDLALAEEETKAHSTEEGQPEGRTGIHLNPTRQQLIGVTYGTIKKEPLTKEIAATGKVAFDPDLYTAIEEYRQAFISLKAIKKQGVSTLKSQAKTLVDSAKTKLLLMGFTEEKLANLIADPKGGIDLLLPSGKAWIYAEVFEYETNGLKIGQKLEAISPSNSNSIFRGIISSINPGLSNQNRTVRVRAEVEDPHRSLRPDSFMNVKIFIDYGVRLVVPDEAVLFSHGKSFVFLVKEEGQFEPRSIEIGEKTSNKYEILSGLKEGDKIVTSANFLIDSESKLRSVLEKSEKANSGAHQ